jgi:assimilatory nitrate reductase catalytic subunit
VIAELATRLGYGMTVAALPRAVFTELRRASAGGSASCAGVTWERIDAESRVSWPCPTDDHPGAPQLFPDRPAGPDGRTGRIAAVRPEKLAA